MSGFRKRTNPAAVSLLIGLCLSVSAWAVDLSPGACKARYCGPVSAAPGTVLINVTPDPLATVGKGSGQRVMVDWSVRFGLPASFEFCVNSAPQAPPHANDPCTELPGASVLRNGVNSTTFRDELKLSAAFYRPTADFYIKTLAKVVLLGGTPRVETSNLRPFVWPLTLPNLYAHHPDWEIRDKDILLVHETSNRGLADAGSSYTLFDVDICDGLADLPLADPEDSASGVCDSNNPDYVANVTFTELVNYVPEGRTERAEVVFTSTFDSLTGMYGLWLSITATVDVHNDLDESNETDNTRSKTVFVQ